MKNKILSMFDYALISLIFTLITIGILFIYSSSINSLGISQNNEHIKQIIWFAIGLVFMVFFTVYDYRRLEKITLFLYIGLLLLLILVLIFGKTAGNAQSWLKIGPVGIQPSEIGKFSLILFTAYYLNKTKNDTSIKRFIVTIVIMIIPLGLILMQPDIGSASVYIAIVLTMCFIAGIKIQYIIYVIAFGLLTIFLAIIPSINRVIFEDKLKFMVIITNMKFRLILIAYFAITSVLTLIFRHYFHGPKFLLWISYITSIFALSLLVSILFEKVLSDRQLRRLYIFIDPDKDAANTGYHIKQSLVAIGGGGTFGKGYRNGTQSHLRFLPEQSTDFIFSIFSEETGFLGGVVIFVLYFLLFVKILFVMHKCPNTFGLYISSGIFGMFLFHFFINIGMVMGSGPITGIPLVFMSYGGSALITDMSCAGLLMSIRYRKKDLN